MGIHHASFSYLLFMFLFAIFSPSFFLFVSCVISKMRASNGSHWMLLIAAAAIILSVAEGEDDEEGDEEKEDSFGLLSNGFNADSLSLQVAGISEEIVREYTKLILDVEKGVCSD